MVPCQSTHVEVRRNPEWIGCPFPHGAARDRTSGWSSGLVQTFLPPESFHFSSFFYFLITFTYLFMWCNNLFWTYYEWPGENHRSRLPRIKCSTLGVVRWALIGHQKVCKQSVKMQYQQFPYFTFQLEGEHKVVRGIVEILIWESFIKPGIYIRDLVHLYSQLWDTREYPSKLWKSLRWGSNLRNWCDVSGVCFSKDS